MAEPQHVQTYNSNIAEVLRLVEIHTQLGGATPGRKHNVEVLNKSGIVLLVACWEAYVEDLVSTAFERMLIAATNPSVFPDTVLTLSTKEIKKSPDDREIWKLSGDGWKAVLKAHKNHVFKRHVGNFNTPKAEQIDELFHSLLGLKSMSSRWKWQGMGAAEAKDKLRRLVELRGSIAHRVAASNPVRKNHVRQYTEFIRRLATTSSNAVRTHLVQRGLDAPWDEYSF